MAFNVNDYIKPTKKPFANRIIDPVVSGAVTGQPSSTRSVARSTASSMLNTAGVSQGSIEAISTNTTNNTTSETADAYYAMAGANIQRTSRANLVKSRFGRMTTNDYLTASDPATRIEKSRKDQTIEIIAVV